MKRFKSKVSFPKLDQFIQRIATQVKAHLIVLTFRGLPTEVATGVKVFPSTFLSHERKQKNAQVGFSEEKQTNSVENRFVGVMSES